MDTEDVRRVIREELAAERRERVHRETMRNLDILIAREEARAKLEAHEAPIKVWTDLFRRMWRRVRSW